MTAHPPLAYDSYGLRISVPDGTTHWRILRGEDTEPARFGLEMTRDDLLEICGPGRYKVEAVDCEGQRIGLVTTIAVGHDQPAADRRLVLAAAWLRRGPANDVAPAIAPSEPDPLPPPPSPSRARASRATEVYEEDDHAPRRRLDIILDPPSTEAQPAPLTGWTDLEVCATAHVLRVRNRLSHDEQRRFDDLMRGRRAVEVLRLVVSASEDNAIDILRRVMFGDPPPTSLASHIVALSPQLTPLEQVKALAAVPGLPPEQRASLRDRLASLPAAEAAVLIRTYLAAR